MTGAAFDRAALLSAFDRLGHAAARNAVVLDIAVYGGSALMLASNFRFATEDVDVAEIDAEWPGWLMAEVTAIGSDNGWSSDWLNEAVQFHLSPLADRRSDHVEFGTFPRDGQAGLRVFIPSLDYLLALKLKSFRINDPVKGPQETEDIRNLLRAGRVASIDEAVAVLARFFPRSAKHPEAQRFFLKHIWPASHHAGDVAPRYPG